MKLTDKEAIKELKRVRILELDEMIHDYPEDEVDGRSDWDMIANEAGWLLELFLEGDTSHADDLRDAREILSRTSYGKTMPLNPRTLKPIYSKTDVQCAKDTVNEYNRLVRFVAKLRKMGLTIGG